MCIFVRKKEESVTFTLKKNEFYMKYNDISKFKEKYLNHVIKLGLTNLL